MTNDLSFRARTLVDQSCFGLNIQRAARAVANRFDEAFRPLGLNHWQFGMLMTLNLPNGLSVTELARSLVVDRTTVTANVKPLQRAELLTVTVDEDDARSRRIELTPKGVELLESAFLIWKRVNTGIADSLGGSAGQDVLDGLRSIREI